MNILQRILGVFLVSLPWLAQSAELPPEHHPWARFAPGSWQRLRVTSETYSAEAQKVIRVEEITTSLVRVLEDGVVLAREVRQGDSVRREKQTMFGWDGSRTNESTREDYSLGEVDVEGKTYTCQTWNTTTQHEDQRHVIKTWYCPDHAPYLLKRLVRVTGGQDRHTASTRVTRLAVKKEIQKRLLEVWETQTIVSRPTTITRITSYHSPEVPGGLVQSSSEVRDGQQGLTRRIVRQLVGQQIVR